MATPDVKKTILIYASTAFILLGVLFGMNIMTFIFGSLGPDVAGFDQTAGSVTNESQAWINASGYDLTLITQPGFSGPVVVEIFNGTAGSGLISSDNYTITDSGFLNSSTANGWLNVSISYTYSYDAGARLTSIQIQNDSLSSIQTYSEASDTQFSTISIAIILVILISLFLLFWTYFMGGTGNTGKGGGSFY